MKKAKITTVKDALSVLRGAGVIIDEKKKFQYWTIGMQVTEKIAHAGKILDQQMDVTTGKPEWRTVWMHKDTCACKDCTFGESTKVGSVVAKLKKDKERAAKAESKKKG